MSAPKPAHLGATYASQFADASVVAAYVHRPPYPSATAEVVARLLPDGPARLLEIGCGSGDLTQHLLPLAGRIDAVEPSASMRRALAERVAGTSKLRVIPESLETAELDAPYALAIAGESLHWTEWTVALPRIARVLAPGAALAIANRTQAPLACQAEILELVRAYSTNREYVPYDLVRELTLRGLFREVGRARAGAVRFTQSVDATVESVHSRNGFSRERMEQAAADAFDGALREILLACFPHGLVELEVDAEIVWGAPAHSADA